MIFVLKLKYCNWLNEPSPFSIFKACGNHQNNLLEGDKKLEKYGSIIVCYLEKSFMTASLYNLELIYKPRFLGTSSDFQIAAWL